MLRRLVSSPPTPLQPKLRQNPNRDPRKIVRDARRCLYTRRDCTFLSLSRSSLSILLLRLPFLVYTHHLLLFLCVCVATKMIDSSSTALKNSSQRA